MKYLGRISGNGAILSDGVEIARASYDFEGFSRPRGGVACSGEIAAAPPFLNSVFGQRGLQLRTDGGRLLELRFSDKELAAASPVAQVDVTGDLPELPAEWRGGSSADDAAAPAP